VESSHRNRAIISTKKRSGLGSREAFGKLSEGFVLRNQMWNRIALTKRGS
jgi:hypothetical protein